MEFIAANNHGPADNYPIQRVVMHGTVSPCVPGGARAVARMFANTSRDASTQYVVDPVEVVQCVKDNVIAYGAPPNKGSIHVEQCDMQGSNGARWQDDNHQAMLRLAARLVASLCKKYDIPVVKLSAADLRAGRKGICGHKDVSDAWHQTDHVDPGPDYPWGQFLGLVRDALNPPDPQPPTKRVTKMQWLARTSGLSAVYLTDGITRRWVQNSDQLASIQGFLRKGGLDDAVSDYSPGSIDAGAAGVLVGPDAPDGTH